MNDRNAEIDWGFVLQWLVSCGIGVTIGGMLAFMSMWTAGEAVRNATYDTIGFLVAGALFGGLLALGANIGPGFLMRRHGISPTRWILYGMAAAGVVLGVAFGILFSLFETLDDSTGPILLALLLGLTIGLVQWALLRQAGIQVNEWPVISVLAYMLAMGLSFRLGGEGREWLSLGAMGLALSLVTGLGMGWALRRQTPMTSSVNVTS
jgi:hypothetical protein